MGQAVHVMLFAPSEQHGLDACAAALAELRRVENRLSLFDDASDLCELNRHAGRGAMRVDEDLRTVLRCAAGYQRLTAGAFNVAAKAHEAVTTAEVLLDGACARLPHTHTQLDFGGIGVGYGIDRALAVLRARGIHRAFVDVSGDCGAIGAPPGETGWQVDIADPVHPGAIIAATRLRDAALATSANTVRPHVLNPATGEPARALRQVSIVARTAITADALSTAMLVSGRRPSGALRVYRA